MNVKSNEHFVELLVFVRVIETRCVAAKSPRTIEMGLIRVC